MLGLFSSNTIFALFLWNIPKIIVLLQKKEGIESKDNTLFKYN